MKLGCPCGPIPSQIRGTRTSVSELVSPLTVRTTFSGTIWHGCLDLQGHAHLRSHDRERWAITSSGMTSGVAADGVASELNRAMGTPSGGGWLGASGQDQRSSPVSQPTVGGRRHRLRSGPAIVNATEPIGLLLTECDIRLHATSPSLEAWITSTRRPHRSPR